MTAPVWMNAVIGDFGRAAGLNGLALNERGTAVLKFEDGTALRLEYADAALVVAMTVPSADLRRLLALSHPRARYAFRIRTGARSGTWRQTPRTMLSTAGIRQGRSLFWRIRGALSWRPAALWC